MLGECRPWKFHFFGGHIDHRCQVKIIYNLHHKEEIRTKHRTFRNFVGNYVVPVKVHWIHEC